MGNEENKNVRLALSGTSEACLWLVVLVSGLLFLGCLFACLVPDALPTGIPAFWVRIYATGTMATLWLELLIIRQLFRFHDSMKVIEARFQKDGGA